MMVSSQNVYLFRPFWLDRWSPKDLSALYKMQGIENYGTWLHSITYKLNSVVCVQEKGSIGLSSDLLQLKRGMCGWMEDDSFPDNCIFHLHHAGRDERGVCLAFATLRQSKQKWTNRKTPSYKHKRPWGEIRPIGFLEDSNERPMQ